MKMKYYKPWKGEMHFQKLDGLLCYLKRRNCAENRIGVFKKEKWTIIDDGIGVSKQRNGYDCGVYAWMMVDFVCRGLPLSFTQDHIDYCWGTIAQENLQYIEY